MANALEIVTPKLPDRVMVGKWLELVKSVGSDNINVTLEGGPVLTSGSVAGMPRPDDNATLEPFLEVEDQLSAAGMGEDECRTLKTFLDMQGYLLEAQTKTGQLNVRYVRGEPFDKITISLPDLKNRKLNEIADLLREVGERFEKVELGASLMALADEDLKQYYQHREAELVKLQQLTHQLIERNDEYRQRIDLEKLAYQQRLDGEYKDKEAAVQERASQLDNREEEMELADAKSARRKIRHDLLEKLKPEGGVKLAGQTLRKTGPIHGVFVATVIVLGLVAYRALAAENFDPENIAHILRAVLPFLGLVAMLIWYLRWMDAWLRKNVDEELRYRQLEIDVDRSSWVVEVLAELSEETRNAIPDEVLTALTRNLFSGPIPMKGVSHPAEDAIAALLGSARGIDIEFPGGRVRTDGRSARKAVEKEIS